MSTAGDQYQPKFNDRAMLWSEPEVVQVLHEGALKLWPAAGLERSVGDHDDENEWYTWVEYRLDGKIVHRSARTHVKQGIGIGAIAANFEGT